MTLRLPQIMLDEMIAHATEDLPNECCGIIAGKDSVATQLFRVRNGEPFRLPDGTVEYRASPFRYYMHPEDHFRVEREIDDNDWQILVIYHSHVASEAYPSPTDVLQSQWQGTDPPTDLYPGAYYVLISLKEADNPVVRAFQIQAGKVAEESLEAT